MERKELISEITNQHNRITKARELLLSDTIEAEEYKLLKFEGEEKIIKLEAKVRDLAVENGVNIEILFVLDKALYNLKNLVQPYKNADIEVKHVIIGSIFPENGILTAKYIELPVLTEHPLLYIS